MDTLLTNLTIIEKSIIINDTTTSEIKSRLSKFYEAFIDLSKVQNEIELLSEPDDELA